MKITFFEAGMEAATDVHCNKRQRVDSVGELPTNARVVNANFFQAHNTPD